MIVNGYYTASKIKFYKINKEDIDYKDINVKLEHGILHILTHNKSVVLSSPRLTAVKKDRVELSANWLVSNNEVLNTKVILTR
jgi:hypothetical protein